MSHAGLDQEAIEDAARLLEGGALVAFPTETVYGLGADAENPQAVRKIYQAKQRPENHPLIVHLAPHTDIAYWSSTVSPMARQLMDAFWPGPLTLILPRAAHIPDTVTGGQQSIGLRCPSHPVAQALLRSFKTGRGGIAAPSANLFGHVSPTTAQHVRDEFPASTLLSRVLDGGQSMVGIESTILDLSRGIPVLLRPGHVSSLEIAAILGQMPALPDDAAPRVSGSLASHYAPRTPLVLLAAEQIAQVIGNLEQAGKRITLLHHTPVATLCGSSEMHSLVASQTLPGQPDAYAHGMYAALRSLDQVGADVMLVEALPDALPWHAVADRMRRAAHGSAHVLAALVQHPGQGRDVSAIPQDSAQD